LIYIKLQIDWHAVPAAKSMPTAQACRQGQFMPSNPREIKDLDNLDEHKAMPACNGRDGAGRSENVGFAFGAIRSPSLVETGLPSCGRRQTRFLFGVD
jgi:hypothetical protein